MTRQVALAFNYPQSLAHEVLGPNTRVCLAHGRGLGKSFFQRNRGLWLTVAEHDGKPRSFVDSETGITKTVPGLTGVRLVLLMPTFAAVKKVHADLIEAENAGMWAFLGGKLNRSEWSIKFPGGSWIRCMGMKQADGNRGIRVDGVCGDEIDDIDPEHYDAVARPWLSEPWSLKQILLGGTPRRGRYGLLYREHSRGLAGTNARLAPEPETAKERVEWAALRRCYSFHATYKDAPDTVDPQYVAEVRAEMERDGALATFAREWECSFDSAEGLVYPMFDESFHVREPDPRDGPWSEIIVGVDHGWEHPGVFIVCGVRGEGRDATVHVIEERWEQRKVESEWVAYAKEIRERYQSRVPRMRWYADPSQPARIEALRRGANITLEPGANAVEDGIAAVATRIAIQRVDVGTPENPREHKTARFYVSPKCPKLIRQFSQYRRRRDPNNQDLFLDEIEKVNDDGADALRYAIFSRFGGPSRTRSESGAGW